MQAKDLGEHAPRRWSETIEGIRWLPRLIDKTRSAIAGTLGAYLYGQSPIDRAFLHAAGIGHRAFAQIVRDAPDDAAVLRGLRERSPDDLAAVRAWSNDLPKRQALFMFVLDLDDGYVNGPLRLLKGPANVASYLLAAAAKRLMPSRATEGLAEPPP